MRFGINLPNFGAGMTPDVLAGWASRAEAAEYDLLLVSDHVALTPDANTRSPEPFYEAFTTLAWLAARTERIRIGTGVVITAHRHPILLARMASTLDQLSGGRFVLGAGVGWTPRAFEALKVPFRRRGKLTDEYLRAVIELWGAGPASFDGPTVRFSGVHTGPRPAQSPRPPIWIGGNSGAAIERAIRLGDAWHPLRPDLPSLRSTLPAITAAAARIDRRPPEFCPRIGLDITDKPLRGPGRPLGYGSPEQIHDDLEELAKLGAAYVVLDTDPGISEHRRPPEDDWALLDELATTILSRYYPSRSRR